MKVGCASDEKINKFILFSSRLALPLFPKFLIMTIEQNLSEAVSIAVKTLYGADVLAEQISLQKTKKEFKGHLTLVVFPFLKMSNKSPEETAREIGEYLCANSAGTVSEAYADNTGLVADFNVVKGFLNITIGGACWVESLNGINTDRKSVV